ncbi:NADH dehydrogenase-like protein YjlD [Fundidesulfovibrio magnetotacticus]|uniref:NADH dehydrogenase-like protein YjlD n=1 Tax=Fundidesulfovibrio magnetotacticus TaxID=2730080 RepID=A0A6V8M0S2_9BACT|nr:FAD-dependent oxidoreductase [Fundidesulfovibrio magnetotacticus]GFK94065.1 NADH dehydrogenase-like protein YjlD [Fundidesulfovibrio magnetotacticus]
MGKHLLLLGGGHAHLSVLKEAASFRDAGHHVTLASPSDRHYYSGMGPGLLSGLYAPRECRFNVRAMIENGGGTFIRSRLASLDPARRVARLENGMAVGYDVCSINTGSAVPPSVAGCGRPNVFPVKPIENLLEAKRRIEAVAELGRTAKVLVAGGGAAAFELAGNACALIGCACSETPDISLAPGGGFLRRFPERVRLLAHRSLARRGIKIFEGLGVARLEEDRAVLTDGLRVPYDVALLAVGVRPHPDFSRFGLAVGPHGGLLVDEHLRSASHPDVFGGGDCIDFGPKPLDKVGVYPVRQNPLLLHNLRAALEERPLAPFSDTSGNYMLILNCGDGRGILRKGPLAYEGQTALWLKDRIDRAFMRSFQVSGELEEDDPPA